jgi:hypothetical protein
MRMKLKPLIIFLVLAIASQTAISREVPNRLVELGRRKEVICDNEVSYCYLFKATVDIDSGYLNVWTTDERGKDYVVKTLRKGETVYVRSVFKYKGVMRAQLSILRDDCLSLACSGSVDLRYLR